MISLGVDRLSALTGMYWRNKRSGSECSASVTCLPACQCLLFLNCSSIGVLPPYRLPSVRYQVSTLSFVRKKVR